MTVTSVEVAIGMPGPEHELGIPIVEDQLETTSVENAGVLGNAAARIHPIAHLA